MKIISWNVNGINACIRKGLIEFMNKENADFYCFQEVKSQPKEITGYYLNYNSAVRKGYSGVAVYSKNKPLSVIKGMNTRSDNEGRVITLEFEKYYLINVYFPHARWKLKRIDYKLEFNNDFLNYCKKLNKPLIITGDFNVAHTELDIKNPKQNIHNPGYTIEERNYFSVLLKEYLDTFREYVKEGGHYTWWTYRNNARERNIGWRIDYFLVSNSLKKNLVNSEILEKIKGSDHCPIRLIINI